MTIVWIVLIIIALLALGILGIIIEGLLWMFAIVAIIFVAGAGFGYLRYRGSSGA